MQQAQAKAEWLRGVKAIADFLGVSDRTVARWLETEEAGLPVYRQGGRWCAHTEELARWQRLRAKTAA